MCCSLREKQEPGGIFSSTRPPQFRCLEAQVQLVCPALVTFAPLHQQEAAVNRRIAVANKQQLHVYQLLNPHPEPGEPPNLFQTHVLNVAPGQAITRILFCEEDSSHDLIIAGEQAEGLGHSVQVWNCDSPVHPFLPTTEQLTHTVWKWGEGCKASLDHHRATVVHLACNHAYLLTGDVDGQCVLWQKHQAFNKRAEALLHVGGIADLVVDKLFVYSAGRSDTRIHVWSMPDLSPILIVPMGFPDDSVIRMAFSAQLPRTHDESHSSVTARSTLPLSDEVPFGTRLARLNLLRRPPSRWAGSPGTMRGSKAPRGSLFVAGVLQEDDLQCAGAGVLMEWSFLGNPSCRSLQIVHETPIVDLVYGPYDNGPLITADAGGTFRIWGFLLDRGLSLLQQILLPVQGSEFDGIAFPAMAMEHPYGVYVVTGTRTLSVWYRHEEIVPA